MYNYELELFVVQELKGMTATECKDIAFHD